MVSSLIDHIVRYEFLRNALLAGLLASVVCGVVGSFVVVKRMTFVTGGMAHAVFGGVGIAYFFGVNPIFGALAFALFAAFLMGVVKRCWRQNEDTMISALWSMGMALGVIFVYLTPGYNVDLMSFLFGNILMVSSTNIQVLFILNVVIVLVTFVYYRRLKYLCFDEEYVGIRGFSAGFLYVLLLCVISLTVVVLMQIVGLILIIALLTLPASMAALFSKTLKNMIMLAILSGMAFTLCGLVISYHHNLPSGATIIMVTGIGYIAALIFHRIVSFMNRLTS